MLGTKIREKRMEMGMSLKELAEKTELTPGFLSQIERNMAEPSITSLRKISSILGVAVFYFFMDDEGANPVVKRNERRILKSPTSHLEYELLCPNLDRQMEMFIGKLEPGATTCEEPLSHTGEEVICVLEGTMWIKVGEDEYNLDTGDSIYYVSSLPHQIINKGNEKLVFISTITPPAF